MGARISKSGTRPVEASFRSAAAVSVSLIEDRQIRVTHQIFITFDRTDGYYTTNNRWFDNNSPPLSDNVTDLRVLTLGIPADECERRSFLRKSGLCLPVPIKTGSGHDSTDFGVPKLNWLGFLVYCFGSRS